MELIPKLIFQAAADVGVFLAGTPVAQTAALPFKSRKFMGSFRIPELRIETLNQVELAEKNERNRKTTLFVSFVSFGDSVYGQRDRGPRDPHPTDRFPPALPIAIGAENIK